MVSISNDDIEYLLNLWSLLCRLWELFNVSNNFRLFQTISALYYIVKHKMERFPIKCWDCLEKPSLLSRYSSCGEINTIFNCPFFSLNFYDLIRYCFWWGLSWWDLWIIWDMKNNLWLWSHTIKRPKKRILSRN